MLFSWYSVGIWKYTYVGMVYKPTWNNVCMYQKNFKVKFTIEIAMYRKDTSIRQAPVFRHLRALRKSPWRFIILMNEL